MHLLLLLPSRCAQGIDAVTRRSELLECTQALHKFKTGRDGTKTLRVPRRQQQEQVHHSARTPKGSSKSVAAATPCAYPEGQQQERARTRQQQLKCAYLGQPQPKRAYPIFHLTFDH